MELKEYIAIIAIAVSVILWLGTQWVTIVLNYRKFQFDARSKFIAASADLIEYIAEKSGLDFQDGKLMEHILNVRKLISLYGTQSEIINYNRFVNACKIADLKEANIYFFKFKNEVEDSSRKLIGMRKLNRQNIYRG